MKPASAGREQRPRQFRLFAETAETFHRPAASYHVDAFAWQTKGGLSMTYMVIALVAVLGLAGCGGGADGGSQGGGADTGTDKGTDPSAGVPADGGLSVADALNSDLDGPLMVSGYIVAEGQAVRLCDMLLESFPPQCGGESLLVEGLDLDSYETRGENGVRWTEAPVSVLGDVEGETLRVSDRAA